MATGLRLPLGVDERGGAALEEGDEQLSKIISIALAPCDSANPFQDLGIDEAVIFDLASPRTQARLKSRIERVFRRLEAEKRAKLKSLRFEPAEGELIAKITYINLESDEEKEFVKRYSREA